MLRIQAVKGSPAEAQLFGEDDLAKQSPGHANGEVRPKFETLEVLQFENLQHDGQIDWATLKAPLMRGGEVMMA